MDDSVGGWWLCRCMNGCVGRWVVFWVDVSVDVSVVGWWLNGCVGRWVVVVWVFGWMCR